MTTKINFMMAKIISTISNQRNRGWGMQGIYIKKDTIKLITCIMNVIIGSVHTHTHTCMCTTHTLSTVHARARAHTNTQSYNCVQHIMC